MNYSLSPAAFGSLLLLLLHTTTLTYTHALTLLSFPSFPFEGLLSLYPSTTTLTHTRGGALRLKGENEIHLLLVLLALGEEAFYTHTATIMPAE